MAALSDDLIVSPRYHDMWVTLEATSSALSRGAIISVSPDDNTNAGKYYAHGGNSGAATRPFGVLLDDVAVSASTQAVHVLVAGTVSRAKMDAVNGSGSPKVISAVLLNNLRFAGIVCK